MYKLDILNQDSSLYWTEYSNDIKDLEKWLTEEKTRPYWDISRKFEITHVDADITWSDSFELPEEVLSYIEKQKLIQQNIELATEYIRKRQLEYPPVGDQLDALYKKEHLGDSTEYDAIAAKIAEVKAKYPKPE